MRPLIRSVFSDEKKLSIAALSHTLPDRLIEQVTPNSAIRRWNCSLPYWVDSIGCRNTITGEVAMAGRRRSDRALRDKLRSPGRPPVARQEHRRRFWALIADGLSSEDAAMKVEVSPPVGFRWFRTAGGMAPSHLSRSSKPASGRYLSFVEREEIALLRAEGLGVREVACRLGRAPSTISRELRRNVIRHGKRTR
jgi:hypothetical protein